MELCKVLTNSSKHCLRACSKLVPYICPIGTGHMKHFKVTSNSTNKSRDSQPLFTLTCITTRN